MKKFQVLSHRVSSEDATHKGGKITSTATVRVKVGESILFKVSEGDGPVNALDLALREALEPFFPILKQLHLTDYKVEVVNGNAGTAASVKVTILSGIGQYVLGETHGTSTDVIRASLDAIVKSFELAIDHKT